MDLSLEADFGKLGIYPNHICQNCQDILGKFKEVKTIAHANEPFILQCQDTIWNYGLEEAKEIYDNKATLQEVPDEVNLIEDFSTHIENQTVERMKVLAKDIAVENMEMLNEYGNDAYEEAKGDEEHEKRTDNTEPYSDKVWDHQTIQTTVKYDLPFVNIDKNSKSKRKKCPVCGKSITKQGISTHIRLTHATERLECPHQDGNWRCKKIFKNGETLKNHIDRTHCKITVICPDCGRNVNKYLLMKDHRTQCNPTKEQIAAKTCTVCKKILASKASMALHMKARHGPGESIKQCPECGVEVKFLDQHIKVQHTEGGNLKTIKCTYDGCESMFRVRNGMLQHLKHAHTDEREQCTICGEWLKNLSDHIRTTHKTGKQFPCEECAKIFYNTFDRRVHIERIHQGIKYMCPMCGQTYQGIKDHMKSAHGIQNVDLRQIKTVKTK